MIQLIESVQPVSMSSEVRASCRFYERLGFVTVFQDDPAAPKYAGVARDGVEIHFQWHSKERVSHSMDRPTYRFVIRDVDALYAEFQLTGAITEKTTGQGPWGTREFYRAL